MVVRKYRYISFTYQISNKNINIESLLVNIVKDKVYANFGEKKLYRLHNLYLMDFFNNNNIFIFRSDRDISKYIISSLLTCKNINDIKCSFNLLYVSGIYKKLLKRIYLNLNQAFKKR